MAKCEPQQPTEYTLTLNPSEAKNLVLTLGPILEPRPGVAGIYTALVNAGVSHEALRSVPGP